jgi:preprotein translocase subunit SecA
LNEYKFEAFNIFNEMLYRVKTDVLRIVFGYESAAHRAAQLQEHLEKELPSLRELLNFTDEDDEADVTIEEVPGQNEASTVEEDILAPLEETSTPFQETPASGVSATESSIEWTSDGPMKESISLGSTTNSYVPTGAEPSRNAPCPCGSGLRYKECHGKIATIVVTNADAEEGTKWRNEAGEETT